MKFNLRQKQVKQAHLRKSYYAFLKYAISQMEPETKFVDNWHYEYICNRLQSEVERIARGEPSNCDVLIINVPPRTLKSWMVARALTAWAWTKYPHLKFLGASYSSSLAVNHSVDTRRIIKSEWYQELFGDVFSFSEDVDNKAKFDTNFNGFRMAVGVAGASTGEGGDIVFVDDPVNPKQTNSDSERNKANDWFRSTFWTRLNNPGVGIRIVVMQRLHRQDLTGFLSDLQQSDLDNDLRIDKIVLPDKISDEVYPEELKKEYEKRNGLLIPDLLTESILRTQKKALGPYAYAGQYQQRPTPKGGGKIQRKWFPIVYRNDLPSIDTMKVFTYTDPSEGKPTSDEMASIAWSIHDGKLVIWEVMSVVESFDKFIGSNGTRGWEDRTYDKFLKRNNAYNKQAYNFWEAKSLGQSYVDHINARCPHYRALPDNPGRESKLQRALDQIPSFFSRSVLLVAGAWNEAFLDQIENFPYTDEDGQVDVLASAVRKSDLRAPEESNDDDFDGELEEVDLEPDMDDDMMKFVDSGLI